jgi:hypothetical protein
VSQTRHAALAELEGQAEGEEERGKNALCTKGDEALEARLPLCHERAPCGHDR